jgi:hypothetical protein
MPSTATATNRSAVLCGALQAVFLIVYSSLAEYLLPAHDVVRWSVNLLVLGIIFFIPFLKWVVGADFMANGQGFGLREQYARMGIWGMSVCAVGAPVGLLTRVLLK